MSAPLEMIVARAANGVIGNAGTMPWHIPEDLRHFKTVTMGAAVKRAKASGATSRGAPTL